MASSNSKVAFLSIHCISSVMGNLKTHLQKTVKFYEGNEKKVGGGRKMGKRVLSNIFTQRVVLNWQHWHLLGSVLEMQNLRPNHRPSESESAFERVPQVIHMLITFF